MLVQVEDGVAFRHELARLAVEQSLGPRRRHSLHEAALNALATPPTGVPDPGRLAHHAEAIGDRDAVLRWAPAAASLAAGAGAHREAEAHYGHVLRFASDLEAEARSQMLERRAFECFLTNEFDRAIDSLDQALAIRREIGDQLRVGNVLSSTARVMLKAGRTMDAQTVGTDAVTLLEPLGPTNELARGYATRAQLAMVLDDLDDALAWGTLAIELADRLGDTEVLVNALDSVGSAMISFGVPGGSEKLERSLRLAQEAGLDGEAGRAFANLACAGPAVGDYDMAERYLQPGISFCDERGLDLFGRQLRVVGVLIDLGRGRWEQAVVTGTQLLQHPTRTPHLRYPVLVAIGIVRARRGDPGAWETLDEALMLARSTEELGSFGPIVATRAEALWLEGRDAEIDAETQATFRLALRKKQPWYIGELAYWRWRAGVDHETPPGATARPYALSMAGEWRRASEEWRRLGRPYQAALALSDGDNADAHAQAIAELQALGARQTTRILIRRRAGDPAATARERSQVSSRRSQSQHEQLTG
jgi:tetratricopeptide (TPR) repeat protein